VEPNINFVAENIKRLHERIARAAERSRRNPNEIAIVAVSKTFPSESIQAAYAAGLRQFGENRLQEFESKRSKLAYLQAKWHFIGHLQSNKARLSAQLFDRIDSVDSVALAGKLNAAAAGANKRLPVLLELRLGNEPMKTGIVEGDLPGLAEQVMELPNLELLGLLTIPPYSDVAEQARPYFRKLRELRDGLSRTLGDPLPVLSMGMTHDFEVAIEEGATELRIGTAIFGSRQEAD